MERKLSRRKFVKITAAAATATTFVPYLGCAPLLLNSKGLPTRPLGKTGVEVPLIGLGLGSRFMFVKEEDKALEMLEYAVDHGLFYWDTAAIYENENKNNRIFCEERIGRILPARRKEVFLATKVIEREAEEVKKTIETSLKRLNTDYIDLYQVHSINSVEDAEELGKKSGALEVLHQYRDEKIIRHIGFTGHTTAEGMKKAAELYDFETMLISMNHQPKDQPMEEQAVPAAAENGLGVLAMKVIRPRETITDIDPLDLIRYALSLKHISAAVVGIDNIEVLKTNIELVRNFKPLSEPAMKRMRFTLAPYYRHENLAWMQPGYLDGKMNKPYLALR